MPHPAFHPYCKRTNNLQRKPPVFDHLQQAIKNWRRGRLGKIPFVNVQELLDRHKKKVLQGHSPRNKAGRVQHTCISWAAGFSSFLSLAGRLLETVFMGEKSSKAVLQAASFPGYAASDKGAWE